MTWCNAAFQLCYTKSLKLTFFSSNDESCRTSTSNSTKSLLREEREGGVIDEMRRKKSCNSKSTVSLKISFWEHHKYIYSPFIIRDNTTKWIAIEIIRCICSRCQNF